MTHPFGAPRFSNSPYSDSQQFERSYDFARNRVFLVAIHGGVPSSSHEQNSMQRMRVVVLPANQPSEFDSSELLPGVFRRALPPMPPRPPALPMTREERPRPVRGEILRDQEGRLYEKIGEQIRPLNKLVSSSRGQVLELVSLRNPIFKTHRSFESDATSVDSQEAERENPPGGGRQRKQTEEVNQGSIVRPASETPKPAPYRKLFPDPGQGRVIRMGDFKSMLVPQLAHPERVRDTHRLACYLQVYEVTTVQRLESLAASVLGDAGQVSQLQLMTQPVTQQLGLNSLLRIRPRPRGNFPHEAGLLLPYERVFRLQLAQDPTGDDVAPSEGQPAMAIPTTESFPLADARASTAATELKTTIPERYIKPWEFKSTRDEALYDMNVRATFAGRFTSLTARLQNWIRGHGELKKWQFLLNGKSADDQLWAIPLPTGGVSHPSIREWARKTLETGGYDARTMLLEWEIFWRRKGL